jgi:outer membrane protein with beta-barrel domain
MARATRWLAFACLIVGAPAALPAQAGFFVGGGVVFPSGDYGDLAKTGYGGMAGVRLSFPALPINGRVEGLYLYNQHDEAIDAGSTSLYGGMASATYGIGGPTGLYLIGSVGYMDHHYNAPSGGTSSSEWDFTWGLGGGINFSKLFAEVRYMQRGDTKFIPLMVGIRFGG